VSWSHCFIFGCGCLRD